MCITLHDIALHYFAFHYITYIHDHTCISCTGMQFHIHTDTVTQREKDIERPRDSTKKKTSNVNQNTAFLAIHRQA